MPPCIVCTKIEKPNLAKLSIMIHNHVALQIPETERQKLIKYQKTFKNHTYTTVGYSYSKRAQVYGRRFAKTGFQNMKSEYRHTLAGDRYKDIDIKNAHPVILAQYCEKNKISCEALLYYIADRDTLLKELRISRTLGKKMVLSLLNGGRWAYKNYTDPPGWLVKFAEEINDIHVKVCALNPELYKACKREWEKLDEAEKKKKTPEGSAMNHVLCDLENKIMTHCEVYLALQGVDVEDMCLVFDGFMVPKEVEINMADLSTYLAAEAGYKVVFEEKPMDEALNLKGLDAPSVGILIKDDSEGADFIIAKYKSILKKTGKDGERIFIFHDGVWSENYQKALRSLILDCKIMRMGMNGPKSYSGEVSGANALMTATISKLENEPEFYWHLWDNNLGKIFYKNGFYDFDKATFTESTDVEHSFTTFRIPFDFPERNEEAEALVYNTVFLPIFDDPVVLENYFALIARGMAGCIEDKDWMACRGMRNCGKSLNADAFSAAFPGYVGTFGADNLMVNKTAHTQDVAKGMSCYKKCEWERVDFSNEIKNDGREINGVAIKGVLASGGDVIEVRTNYKDEMQIKLQTRFCLNFNDCPLFNSTDCLQTVNMFVLKSVFNLDPTGTMKQADPNLKFKLKTPEYIAGLTHLLLGAYKSFKPKQCEKVKEWSLSLRENNGKDDDLIGECFEKGEEADFVLNVDLKKWRDMNKKEMSMDKLGDYLEQLGAVNDKHLGGTVGKQGNLRGYKNLKKKVVDMGEEVVPEKPKAPVGFLFKKVGQV